MKSAIVSSTKCGPMADEWRKKRPDMKRLKWDLSLL